MRRKSVVVLSERFAKLSSVISQYRVVSRLTDDLPMAMYSLSYGLGSKTDEPMSWIRLLNVIKNCADQFYYPVEHVAWAADMGLLRLNSLPLWYFGDMLWLVSLTIGLVLSYVKWRAMALERRRLRKQLRDVSRRVPGGAGEAAEAAEAERAEVRDQLTAWRGQKHALLLRVAKDVADLCCAIHWLPAGWLWAEKLPEELVGVLGATSGGLGLALLWPTTA